jgi:hypothetical protein
LDIEESFEIEKRRMNLTFHGVRESDVNVDDRGDEKHPDEIMIDEILQDGLKMDAMRHIEDVTRIGKFVEGTARPIRVKLKSVESRTIY